MKSLAPSSSQPPDFLSGLILKTRGSRLVIAHRLFCVVFYSVIRWRVFTTHFIYFSYFVSIVKPDPHIFGKPIRINPRPVPSNFACNACLSALSLSSLYHLVLLIIEYLSLRLPFTQTPKSIQPNSASFYHPYAFLYPSYVWYLIACFFPDRRGCCFPFVFTTSTPTPSFGSFSPFFFYRFSNWRTPPPSSP